ncbi:Sec23-binding domain of Sec16-domain-containing protein [Roridomyces roridus]|uniref:Protein transport protein sec16 n=1 Tax=Roridomyces roridus TaxID=1738132 RepID=A0AAD7BWX3_9AGAR|nr:Sec23-binding domain of Sec16-domain-containing protein [Roridomyces roridus]
MSSSTAEAAASLFGSDDAASDLFASLGTEPAADPIFDTAPPSNSTGSSWPETSQYTPQEPLASQQDYAPQQDSYPQAAATQWQQQYQAPATGTVLPSPQTLSYAPYAPVDNRSVPSPTQPAYNPYSPPAASQSYAATTASQSAYGSYAPATPSYAPATPSYAPTTPSYAPATPSYASTTPSYGSSYSAPVANTAYASQTAAAIPPPPPPAQALNRPKVSNAYDPPFPTSRPARRGVSSSSRSSPYVSQAPAPPPALPAGGQFTASGYQLPPPPPAQALAHANHHAPPASVGPPRPPSSTYAPSGEMPHHAPVESAIYSPETAPMRSSSPAKAMAPQPPSRSNSISSQTSGRSVDASFFPLPTSPDRASSPASLSARSSTLSPDPYTNGPVASVPVRTSSPASVYSLDRTRSPPSLSANPYLPSAAAPRAPSPLKQVYDEFLRPSQATSGFHSSNQYLPQKINSVPPPAPNRSASSGSIYSVASSSPEHPAPPSQYGHASRQRSETDYGSYTSRYNYNGPNEVSAYELPASQEITMKPVHATAYAPSPSLLGANDPLGRTSSRAPVISFGFAGKLLTCFHGASMNTGFDVALSSRNSTGIHIRQLNNIIPQSALEVSSATYPGPLFSDPGTPTTGLTRAAEISQGIGYLHAGSIEGRQAEGKRVLVNLLRVLVENDGRLSGTYPNPLGASELDESPIATCTLRPSALDKIQDFLLRGERRKAYHYALDERLWAHAMIIASSIDRDSWKETVNEFLRTELGSKSQSTATAPSNGREGLRVAYSLYSGQGSASVQELVPQNLLARATGRLQVPTASHATPMTPNFAAPALANNIPTDSLAAWADTAAMMLSSPMNADTSAALTALGDQLLAHQVVEAAHACYLLSPQTSPVGGIGNPSARIVLVGSRSPQVWPSFYKDSDPVILTEILEFALSLATPAKGQEPFYGLPHLQAYRFIRAISLAELGELQLASRYCEAITISFSRASPYFTGPLMDQLKALTDRIVGLDHSDNLDTIGRFLEGRFTKLVTGDVDPGTPTDDTSKPSEPPAGTPSLYNLNAPPTRSGSAMGHSGLKPTPGIDRASSAMDHVRRRPSPPAPRIASANASTTTFAQAPSFAHAYGNYSPNPYTPSMTTPKPAAAETTHEEEEGGQEVSWWGSSSYANDSANQTPMAATFMQVDSEIPSSSDGFISLMDNSSYSVAPRAQPQRATSQPSAADATDEEKEEQSASAGAATTAPARPDIKPAPAATSSWLGRWWKRSDSSPGPVKANLGEETSFVYDKELKRWVNKNASAEAAKPATPPPPPPSRPQTASPGMTGPRTGNATPPPAGPARSASVADFGAPPANKGVLRVRSNLSATPESASLPSSPLRQSSLTPPSPPPGRPKSQASKRAIRSRYVDVFQQEGGGAA